MVFPLVFEQIYNGDLEVFVKYDIWTFLEALFPSFFCLKMLLFLCVFYNFFWYFR